MSVWQIWVIVALILFIAEIFTPGFLVASFGIGCLMAALISALGANVEIQLLIFAVTTLAVFFGIRPFFLRIFYHPGSRVSTNVDALIGERGRVTNQIDPLRDQGRVIISGEDWKAISHDDNVIEKDEMIQVIRVDGTKLIVKQVLRDKEE